MRTNSLLALPVLAGLAAASPLAFNLQPRAPTTTTTHHCKPDRFLRKFLAPKNIQEAVDFCGAYISSTSTTYVEVPTGAATSEKAVTTVYEKRSDGSFAYLDSYQEELRRRDYGVSAVSYPTWLPTKYPASRVSSACSCVSMPQYSTTVVVTSYIIEVKTCTLGEGQAAPTDAGYQVKGAGGGGAVPTQAYGSGGSAPPAKGGHGSGYPSGGGNGNGNGYGSGNGNGNGNGNGHGNGNGNGYPSSSGNGHGNGSGGGNGYKSGGGSDNRNGYESSSGNGNGSGHGNGSGNGHGSGSGSGGYSAPVYNGKPGPSHGPAPTGYKGSGSSGSGGYNSNGGNGHSGSGGHNNYGGSDSRSGSGNYAAQDVPPYGSSSTSKSCTAGAGSSGSTGHTSSGAPPYGGPNGHDVSSSTGTSTGPGVVTTTTPGSTAEPTEATTTAAESSTTAVSTEGSTTLVETTSGEPTTTGGSSSSEEPTSTTTTESTSFDPDQTTTSSDTTTEGSTTTADTSTTTGDTSTTTVGTDSTTASSTDTITTSEPTTTTTTGDDVTSSTTTADTTSTSTADTTSTTSESTSATTSETTSATTSETTSATTSETTTSSAMTTDSTTTTASTTTTTSDPSEQTPVDLTVGPTPGPDGCNPIVASPDTGYNFNFINQDSVSQWGPVVGVDDSVENPVLPVTGDNINEMVLPLRFTDSASSTLIFLHDIAVTPGVEYTITLDVRITEGDVGISLNAITDVFVSPAFNESPTTWQSLEIVATAGVDSMTIRFEVSANGAAEVYLDALRVVPTGGTPLPGPPTDPGSLIKTLADFTSGDAPPPSENVDFTDITESGYPDDSNLALDIGEGRLPGESARMINFANIPAGSSGAWYDISGTFREGLSGNFAVSLNVKSTQSTGCYVNIQVGSQLLARTLLSGCQDWQTITSLEFSEFSEGDVLDFWIACSPAGFEGTFFVDKIAVYQIDG
ncbi:hypothetical protein TWF696_006663 [Orbilia brochopaga]|uniref:CBM-cenC domain-containing protein n=1 Tax=Orbilia brochopaga TaxID=3140254 RepID=A0AAV9UQN9_9PEZI